MPYDLPPNMTDQCMVLKTRKAARAITRRYNALLKPHGIQSTQASLLYAIAGGGFESISELADMMAIERSALTRNLQLLRDAGYINSDHQGRGRAQKVALTNEGEALLEIGVPLWVEAQNALRTELGEKEWRHVQTALTTIGMLA